MAVRHNESAHRFELEGGNLAHLDYRLAHGAIDFTHTEVPEALEGQGVGAALVRAGLDYARESKLRVISHCPFVTTYLSRHPEYGDLTS